jgi:uncharacterized repeat protein (TIGR01451 family)
LTANKIAMPEQVRPGESLMYAIHLTNEGDGDADVVTLVDELPPEITALNGVTPTVGNYEHHNGVITWTGALAPSDHVVITLSTDVSSTVSHDTYFTNTVTITGTGHEIQAAAEARVIDTFYYYMPFMLHRWPPRYYLPVIMRKYPPIPVLDPITIPDINSYTVSWSIDATDFDRFVLQESLDGNFDSINNEWALSSSQTSLFLDAKSFDTTYYYRVRADNDDSWGEGPWSNIESVTTPDYYYDGFDDPNSGWPTHQARCCIDGCDSGEDREHLEYKYNLYYGGGRYKVKIPLDCRGGGNHGDTRHIYPVVFAPQILRPTSRTCIHLRGRFEEDDPYWSFWGLVFAAKEDKSIVYSLEVNNLGDWGIVKRTGYQYPGPNHPWLNEERKYINGYTGTKRWPGNDYSWNTLKAEVTNDQVKLYINGHHVDTFSEGAISSLTRVGIIGGDWEIAPTQIGFEYFIVDEGCDDF